MTDSPEDNIAQTRITPRLIDSLYTEAMLLADEASSPSIAVLMRKSSECGWRAIATSSNSRG